MAGYALAAAFAVTGELIWLGDPLRLNDLYWIDWTERLTGLLAIVPVLWVIGAAAAMRQKRKTPPSGGPGRGAAVLVAVRALLVVVGSVAAGAILLSPDKPARLLAASGAALALTLIDLALEEATRRRSWPRRAPAVAGALAVLGGILFWPTPYGVTSPGFTLNMNRYASVEGGVPKSSIEGVLVIDRPAFPIDWVYAALLPHIRIEKRDTSISIGQMQQQARVQRVGANQIGSALAFKRAGLGEGIVPNGVYVLLVSDNAPSAGQLQGGDRITGVNGREIASIAQLSEAMGTIEPGAKALVRVQRGDDQLELEVATAAAEDDSGKAVFGIQVEDALRADLPGTVDYRSYLVYQGGPSHGAILTLTLIDQLTPGGVTFGNRVAGTGTIRADGSVGRIGGIEQKAYAVGRTDADVFFVPAGQEEDARNDSKQLQIVPVNTLDDMLNWLRNHPKT